MPRDPQPPKRRNDDLIERIKEATEKLSRDGSTRGDLKIISRAMRELRYAFKVFTPFRWRRKVTVFGSARTREEEPAYQQAVDFGHEMALRDWMVITGAAAGIMEAGHRGAGREHSMGLNIMLPFEQGANPVIAGDDKLVNMKYFFTRKLMFVKECDAVVCLPGGFGTLDEAFEVMTLLQTGKRDLVPLVLLDAPGGRYWNPLDDFIRDSLLSGGMISPEDLRLYKVTDSVEEAVEEVLSFYDVYHSMRFVKKQLVIRMLNDISDELLEEINREFQDIIAEGAICRTSALPEEADETELEQLPRLMFQFNRRNLGRLRELIDVLNTAPV